MKKRKVNTSLRRRAIALFLAIIFVIPASGFALATDELTELPNDLLLYHVEQSDEQMGLINDLLLYYAEQSDDAIREALQILIGRAARLSRTIVAESADRVPMDVSFVSANVMAVFQTAIAPFMPTDVMAMDTQIWDFSYFVEESDPRSGAGAFVAYEPEEAVVSDTYYVTDEQEDEVEPTAETAVEAYVDMEVFSDDLLAIVAVANAILVLEGQMQVGTLTVDPSFTRNVQLIPELWCPQTLTTAPAFTFTGNNTHDLVGTTWNRRDANSDSPLTIWDNEYNIIEEVFIELPIDSDGDGRRDFVRATIRRPIETERYDDLRLAAFLEVSPYRDGTNANLRFHYSTPELTNLPATPEGKTYADVESNIPRAAHWPWDIDDQIVWDNTTNAWVSDSGAGCLRWDRIPQAVPQIHEQYHTNRSNPVPATGGGGHSNVGGAFASQYMFVRGYVNIAANVVGNTFADGFSDQASIAEQLSSIAVTQWLNGRARGFTSQDATVQVDPTSWSNGMVFMSGTSYPGSMTVKAAATGVEGLGAIIPMVALANTYYYFRSAGSPIFPGFNNDWHGGFPGEESNDQTQFCSLRFLPTAGNAARVNAQAREIPSWMRTNPDHPEFEMMYRNYNAHWHSMHVGQGCCIVPSCTHEGSWHFVGCTHDRHGRVGFHEDCDGSPRQWDGLYNMWWDQRNPLTTADEIRAGVIWHHGLHDFNVRPQNFDIMYRAVTHHDNAEIRLFLHRGGHTSKWTHEAIWDWHHLWIDYFLYGIENNVVNGPDPVVGEAIPGVHRMPTVIMASSVDGQYEQFSSWPIEGTTPRRYFLAPSEDASSAAGFLSDVPPDARDFVIQDNFVNTPGQINRPATGAHSLITPGWVHGWNVEQTATATNVRTPLIHYWESNLFNVADVHAQSDERLVFITEITEDVRLSGVAVASIEAASDRPWGNITAALVEIPGPNNVRRAFGGGANFGGAAVLSTTSRTIPAHNGVGEINLLTPSAPRDLRDLPPMPANWWSGPQGAAQGWNNFWREYRVITMAHAGIQNPNNTDVVSYQQFPDTIPQGFSRGRTYMEAAATNFVPQHYFTRIVPAPGEFNVYTFAFEVNDWEFQAGNYLAVFVYTTDYRYTLTPPNPPEVTIRTGSNTFVDIPSIQGFNTTTAQTDPLSAAVALVRATANAHEAANRPTAINHNTITALGDGILAAARAALGANEELSAITAEWVMPFAGERATVSEPGIMAGTIRLSLEVQVNGVTETRMAFVSLMYEILPQVNVTPPQWWIDRSLVPGLAEGNPAPRNDLEKDLFNITYVAGPRLWGSPNERRAAEFVVERFEQMITENPQTTQGAEARVWVTSLTEPNHPESLARGNANIGRFVRANGIHDFYGMAMPILDAYEFPTIQDANGIELVDLGIFPNLTVPATASGTVTAVVRFSSAHLDMQNHLLPALEALVERNENLDGFELVIIARYHPDRPIWNTMAVQFINRPQDLRPASANQINFAMYPAFYGYEAMLDAGIPFMLVAHENLVEIQELAAAGELVKIYRHQRTDIHSPYLRLPASDNPDNPDMVVVVTGHFDSVATTQGVSDNAGSAAAMMEAARRLAAIDRGGIEFRFFPHGGHEAGHNAGSEAFFPGGIGFSVAFDEFVRALTAEGLADISVIYHHDMIISPGPTPAGAFMPTITVNGHWQTWRTPNQGNASPFNLAQHLLMTGAYNMRNHDANLWAPGRTTVNATRGGAGEATNAYREHNIVSSGKSTGLEVAYHNTRDNLKENYCYYRLRMAAEILVHGKLAAVEQNMSRRADFTVNTEAGTLTLNNAAQLFNAYARVEGTLLIGTEQIAFEIAAPNTVFSFPAVEGSPAIGIRNVAAYGSTFLNVSATAATPASLRVVLAANYVPTPAHMRSLMDGLRVSADMPAFSVGYPVREPFVMVDGVGYISNRVFADLIGGQQHYWQVTMNQVVIHGSTTISGYDVQGNYISLRVPGWRNPATATAVTHPGWWTEPVAQSFHAYISVNGGAEQRVDISSVEGLSGNIGVHVRHMAAYLPLLFLADVFGFELEMDGETPILVTPPIAPEPVVFSGNNPNVLRALLEDYDVILKTAGNLGIFTHHSPFAIPAGRTLTVATTLNVQANAELIIDGTLIVQEGGRVNNQGGAGGTIRIENGGRIINNGHVENVTNSTVINYGTIENNARFEVRANTTFCSCDGVVTGSVLINTHRNAITCENG